jgi:hypothetical protein
MKPINLTSIEQALRALMTSDPYCAGATVFTVTNGRVDIVLQVDDVFEGLLEAPLRLVTTRHKFSHYGIRNSQWSTPLVDGEYECDPADHPDCQQFSVMIVTG